MRSLSRMLISVLPAMAIAAFPCVAAMAADSTHFAWQHSYATVDAKGDLAWRPLPYNPVKGGNIRYIDYEAGNDANSGNTPAQAWKHHPWDAMAKAQAKAGAKSGIDTYLFKGGSVYRGRLNPQGEGGQPDHPIRLMSDPAWGKGNALIYGSERVSVWRRGAYARMPDGQSIWCADVDFLARTLWLVADDGRIERLRLARDPNWKISDPNEVLSEWPTWEQPDWWTGKNVVLVDGRKERHQGIDSKRLKGLATADILGATVWTEWGIVMGSPYPARVEAYDPEKGGVAFRGPWTHDMSEKIITGNRYYLEDKPQWLDEPGEFWVEKLGDSKARIYLRLPNEQDPNRAHLEAGSRTTFLKSDNLRHIEIAGLTFRFTNIHWEYDLPQWGHDHLRDAVIRLAGGGDGIKIHHNVFEHVVAPIRIVGTGESNPYPVSPIGSVSISDNVIRHTDHDAVVIEGHCQLDHVELLRNRFSEIGHRNLSGLHGGAVTIKYADTSLVAGNILDRVAGWGITLFGGGRSRQIVTQNRVESPLLKSNDWGGIETWHSGSFYVFNNLVLNPRGFMNWTLKDKKRIPAFGHAYYLDHSFKNYLFNNIAGGYSNEPGNKYANCTALQNIVSFENAFFHNTFHCFGEAVRQQAPDAGRFLFLSNVIDDASILALRNADPKDIPPDPNAAHYQQKGDFDYETLAFARNAFSAIKGRFGVFEETGAVYDRLPEMRQAMERLQALEGSVGVMSDQPLLRQPDKLDFRPSPGRMEALASRVFVPWALWDTVGEWPFRINRRDPTLLCDQKWNDQSPTVGTRNTFQLRGVNITAANFVDDPLENWTRSALRLNGRDQFLTIRHADLVASIADAKEKALAKTKKPAVPKTSTVDIEASNMLIETYLRTEDNDGLLVQKRDGAGYELSLEKGCLKFTATDTDGQSLTVRGQTILADGKWRHLLVELDRKNGVNVYIDGISAPLNVEGVVPTGSLSNQADFFAFGNPDGGHLAGEFAFLRMTRSTLADSKTTIGELRAWQFDGPHLRDFSGQPRDFERGPAGALGASANN